MDRDFFNRTFEYADDYFNGYLSNEKLNIENMVNASKKDNAYTLLEVTGDVSAAVEEKLEAVENVIRVRVI